MTTRSPAGPAEAYDRGAGAWASGAEPAYQRFATALVELAPSTWVGAPVVDIAAGGGAVSAALRARGARPVAVDAAPAMLAVARKAVAGLSVVAGDALRLPLATSAVEGAAVGFCVNHVPQPAVLLAEAGRVVRHGGTLLASTFARGPDHPAKAAVDEAARSLGWEPSEWYAAFREHALLSDTPDLLVSCAERAGLVDVQVHEVDVDSGLRSVDALVRWRLGMPELAGFASTLDQLSLARLRETAAATLGPDPGPLIRRVLLLRCWTAS